MAKVKVTRRTTNNEVRYTISGLTFDQMFRIKHAMHEHAERLKGIIRDDLAGHKQMQKMFEGYVQDALDIFEAVSDLI